MAKMFYTLDEAATKLGKSAEDVRQMAQSGRIQEFRDRDKLMFKVDQIDLLALSESGDDGDEADMSSVIPLADSVGGDAIRLADSVPGKSFGGDAFDLEGASGAGLGMGSGVGMGSGLGLGDSGSGGPGGSSGGSSGGLGIESPKQKTGVSIFDADDLDTIDPSAVTQMSDGGLDDFSLEPVGSGSGLLDLTRESDDTSLGAVDFLEEMGGREAPEPTIAASGLFEGSGDEVEAVAIGGPGAAPGGVAMMMAEPYDGPGSGLVAGLSFGAAVAMALALVIVVTGMMGLGDGGLTAMIAGNFWIAVGALAGVTLLGAGLGFVLGKRA